MVKDKGGSFVFLITIAASSTDWSISYLSSVTVWRRKKGSFQNTFSARQSTILTNSVESPAMNVLACRSCPGLDWLWASDPVIKDAIPLGVLSVETQAWWLIPITPALKRPEAVR